MKKLLLGAFIGMFTLTGVAVLPNNVLADDPTTYGAFSGKGGFGSKENNQEYNPDVAGKDNFQGDSLIKTIKTAINWVLGMLSFIALLLCLWGGFKMMTSGGDEKKYSEGLNILKWAAIGLAIIALSWLIVSAIFWLINSSINTSNASAAVQPTPQQPQ